VVPTVLSCGLGHWKVDSKQWHVLHPRIAPFQFLKTIEQQNALLFTEIVVNSCKDSKSSDHMTQPLLWFDVRENSKEQPSPESYK
jgi:hypothetical protein